MRAFSAIVKLTLRSAMRSHIFQLLLGLLVLCAVMLPMTVSGSGEGARSYIQIALMYSLGTVGFILALSTVWISSLVMTQDVESYQLHMVVSKPVSRIKIFCAKYASVVLLHAVLLGLAGITIFGGVMWRFAQDDIPEEEKERIRNEVLVGRRVYYPEPPDMDKLTREALAQQLEEMRKAGNRQVTAQAGEMEAELRKGLSQEMLRQRSEVLFQKYGEWTFKDLPQDKSKPIYLRYRCYVGKVDSEAQRYTTGLWAGYIVERKQEAMNNQTVAQEDYTRNWMALSQMPEQNYAGEFHEKVMPPQVIDPDGNVNLRYINLDNAQDKVYFQTVDGPKLLISVSSFAGNFIRGLLVILLMVMVYAGITCAVAAAFSMPTAIFAVLSYMFLGSVAPLIMTTSQLADPSKYAGYWIGKVIMKIVAPLQEFEISYKIASGELVEFSYIGGLFCEHFLLQALPFIVLGVFLYWRRELGLVIRK
ncbi:MAG: hypothetical protein E7056_03460 [Lentisphaerae bacterium]|nr:hypothetical protein [Lentisphaerota bacterium]